MLSAASDTGNAVYQRHSVSVFITDDCTWISARLVADAAGYSGTPLQMYEPRELYAETGDEVRLFCEAFVGKYWTLTGNLSLHVIIWRIQILPALHPRPVLTDSLVCNRNFLSSWLTTRILMKLRAYVSFVLNVGSGCFFRRLILVYKIYSYLFA